jgi:uncharacterized protein
MISTALAASLVDEFGDNPELKAVGGRALREMTRISSSPYSMWRDIALTNTAYLEHAMARLEQRIAHLRENLRSQELRGEFERANRFEHGTRDAAASVLVIPGWQNSGPRHWQTIWEQQSPIFLRVQQKDWEFPHREWWVQRISEEVRQAPAPIVFAAHSLGCVAVAHWCQSDPEGVHKVKGALMVAPTDVDSKEAPRQTKDFAPIPRRLLPFPSIVVASSNDPFLTVDRARSLAHEWGSRLVEVGAAGHVNADSGLGDWPEGKRLLRHLIEGA